MTDDVSRETRTVDLPEHDYAREAFDHYREHANQTTHDGKLIPTWEALAPETRDHWSAAANRVLWLATENRPDVSRETSTGEETFNG